MTGKRPDLPDPNQATSLDDLVALLRQLKAWAQDKSYAVIARQVNDRWARAGRPRSEHTTRSTVARYFAFGRSRLDEELLVAIVSVLHQQAEYAERWRHALRAIRGDAAAAALVDTRPDLPAAPRGFIGRQDELCCLVELAKARRIVVVSGMAGIGKTWLAIHAVHRLAADHGVRLAAHLRGFDPIAPPASPSAVLVSFLRHLGLRHGQVPRHLSGQVQTYRALTGAGPALVLLDDAIDEDSVAPLVPGGDAITIITSRRTLAGLREAAHLRLEAPDRNSSLDLLRQVAGSHRVDSDLAGAQCIIEAVGRHPMALSVIGGHMREHPDWSAADYAQPVALALDGGIRAALADSLRRLPAATRRVWRLLALHPGRDLSGPAVAALTDRPVGPVRAHLTALVDAQLVRQPSVDRYALHELVRGHAVESVGLEEPASQVRAAVGRLYHYYRWTAANAVAQIKSDRVVRTLEYDQACRWIADEYENLLLIMADAAVRGWPGFKHKMAG